MRIHFQHIAHAGVLIAALTLWGCGTTRTTQNVKPTKPTTTSKPVIKDQPQSAPLPPQRYKTKTTGMKWGDIDWRKRILEMAAPFPFRNHRRPLYTDHRGTLSHSDAGECRGQCFYSP